MSRQCLAAPLQVRDIAVRNRIVMSAMTRGYCPSGVPGPAVAEYYARRARGGCGLIVTEAVGIDHPSALGDAGLGEDDIPVMFGAAPLAGWRAVVDAVHAADGRIVPQLWHQGVMRIPGTGPNPAAPTIGPSGIWGPLGMTSVEPRKIPSNPTFGPAMTDAEIADVIDSYVRSARNAAAIGFDGVALHGGHGYLLDNFLWDGTNRRADRWGGDRRRRAEAVVQVIRGIRVAIGPGLPIFFRFSQWKQQDFKAVLAETPAELEEVLSPLADAGVDVFDASVRYFDRPAFVGSDLNLAGWARKVTGKLSMTVGGVGMNKGYFDAAADLQATDNLDLVVRRFERDEFDLVAVGRAVIGDPEWANKSLRGELPEPFHLRQLDTLR
jgi:2,4-dienoyl-CoA reductase-like NADH-dependent reductase (Old Yellow Enzyme family)